MSESGHSESLYSLRAKIALIGRTLDREARGLYVWQHGSWKAEWWGRNSRAIVAASATSKEAALDALLRGLIATAAAMEVAA